MDPIEKATEDFLSALSMGLVAYEPNGSTTFPDFLLDGRVAVEATRLVKTIDHAGQPIRPNERLPSIYATLENALEQVEVDNLESSYFVATHIRFPINQRQAPRSLRTKLQEIAAQMRQGRPIPDRLSVCSGLEISIIRSSERFATPFVWGGGTPYDLAGWLLPDLIEQTRDAIQRKAESIVRSEDKYSEYWLAVSSDLTTTIPPHYLPELQKLRAEFGPWSKVVFVNGVNPPESFVLEQA